MASITRRKNSGRTGQAISFVATVRRKGFDSVSKSFATRPEAKSWADATERELLEHRGRGGLRSDVATLTIGELVSEYQRDPSVAGQKAHGSSLPLLDWWADAFGTTRCMEFGVLTLREARDRLANSGLRKVIDANGQLVVRKRSAATVNRYLAALRATWNWGRRNGLLPTSAVWPDGLALREPRGRVRFLSDVELARLLAAARHHSAVMYAAITVSIGTGIRQGELLALMWTDVDLDAATLRIRDSKNGESRAPHLPSSAAEALRSLRTGAVVSLGPMFTNPDGTALDVSALVARWRKIREAARLEDFHWHDLRHSCASMLARYGASLPEIAHQLGHKSTAVTSRYTHLLIGRAVTGHDKLDEAMHTAINAPPAQVAVVVQFAP